MIYRASFILAALCGGFILGVDAALDAGGPGGLAIVLGVVLSGAGVFAAAAFLDWLDSRD